MHLGLIGRDEKAFPAVDDPAKILTVKIWDCPFRSSPVARFENLEGLEILGLRDESFDFLAGLKKLRYLSVVHLPKVTDLEGLRDLPVLEVLKLHTLPSWDSSSRRAVVSSIEPIARLPELRHLELFSVVSEDRSLSPLERSKSLETARFQGFPKREIARFEAATGLPNDFAPVPAWSRS